MKKIGIVTLSNSTNYGGVLQSVALSITLKKLGMEGVNITCQKMPSLWKSPVKYVRKRVSLYGCKGLRTKLRICGGICKTILSNIHYIAAKKKRNNFQKFIDENLTITPYYESYSDMQKYCSGFDGYITGSDQVWNNEFTDRKFRGSYFLDFVPEGIPCFSYAASAGGEKSDSYVQEIIRRTKHFRGISVREHSLEIKMRQLGCEKVQTVLDPTLLLTKEEWIKLEKKPKKILPEHYLLVYFLEKKSSNNPVVKKSAQELKLPVVDIMPDYKGVTYQRIIDDTAGPAEFLYYVNHADYIITNSFHMVVFALLFRKKFVALQREGQESRIHDLLQLMELQTHEILYPEQWGIIKEEIKNIKTNISQIYTRSIGFLEQIKEQV